IGAVFPILHLGSTSTWLGKLVQQKGVGGWIHICPPSTTTTVDISLEGNRVLRQPWVSQMKFTITREQLSEGVSAVNAAVPAKTTLPVLANILLEATKDGLRLSGTDLDISVGTTVPASVDQEGAITLPARKLAELVRELPSAGIRVTTQGEQRVTIECGRSKFKLLGLPREEFPAFPQVSFDKAGKT